MMVPVPDDVTDEVAVLADPFSVSLHAVTRTPPPPGGRAVVYGAGALGHVRRRHPAGAAPRRRGRHRRPVAGPGGAGRPARRHDVRAPSRASQLDRGAGGVVRWRPAPAVGRAADRVARRRRRRLRHRRRARDRRGRPAGAARPGARSCSSALSSMARCEWTPLVLQGGCAGRLQRLRRRGGRRRPAATPSPTTSTSSPTGRIDLVRPAHPHVRPRRLAERVPDADRPGRDRRDQGRLRPPLTVSRDGERGRRQPIDDGGAIVDRGSRQSVDTKRRRISHSSPTGSSSSR